MKKVIDKIMALLKTKNVEMTDDEKTNFFADIIESVVEKKPLPADIVIPDNIQHNSGFLKELQSAFQNQVDSMSKKSQEQIDALMASNSNLEKMLGEERTLREQGLKAIEEKAKKDKAEKISTVIADMVKNEKIPANNEELKKKYETMLDNDYETTLSIIEAIPGNTAQPPKDVQGAGGTPPIPQSYQHTALASIVIPRIMERLDKQATAN